MTTPTKIITGLLSVLCILLFTGAIDISSKRQAWEYTTASLSVLGGTRFEEKINAMGDKGWELVSAVGKSGQGQEFQYDFFFKRPK